MSSDVGGGGGGGGGGKRAVWVFYHLQQEKGESSSHPNAFQFTPANPERITLSEVLDAFPLKSTSSFHFRFQVSVDKTPMYLDLINPADIVPLSGPNIIAKVLRLDNTRAATRNSYGLRFKPTVGASPTTTAPTAAKPAASAPTSASSPSSLSPSTTTAGGAGARSGAGASGGGGVTSPSASGAGVPALRPVKPVPSREEEEDLPPPPYIDDDMKDKTPVVQAKVMWRRIREREEAARRVAEVTEKEASAAREMEEKEAARAMYGARLKEWAEEVGGSKKNVRLLLSTMHTVLWPDAKWEPLPMAKLIQPVGVKKGFMKACTIVHPDKHNTMTPTQVFIATTIFHYLESAFRAFQDAEM